jgi:ubiquitin carboxyl-terminal hydrolase 4/11/15
LTLEKNNRDEQFVYDLYAIMVHSGGMGGGHYIAYARHETSAGPKWFYFSDSYWKEVSISSVAKAQAYMLFYKRIPAQ